MLSTTVLKEFSVAKVLEEQKRERQDRGNKDTQTSDPRFDATFKFAHTVGGPQAR